MISNLMSYNNLKRRISFGKVSSLYCGDESIFQDVGFTTLQFVLISPFLPVNTSMFPILTMAAAKLLLNVVPSEAKFVTIPFVDPAEVSS